MAIGRKEIDLSVRKLIIKLYCEGRSFREVGKIVGKTHSTIQKIINKYRYEGMIRNKLGRGRKKLLSDVDERFVCRKINIDPWTNVRNLTSEISSRINKSISIETIRRTLRKTGYHGRIARKKPFVSNANREKRLQFAQTYLNCDENFWRSVIFSDETKINLFGRDGKKQIIWRKPNTEYRIRNMCPTVKHGGGSVMLWGCIGANGTGNMEIINGTMDKIYYLNILKKNMKESAEKLKMPRVYYFQQDNDPKHASYIVQEWLLYNVPKLLKTPPQSPDLNPIEHVWGELKSKMLQHNLTNKRDFETKLREEWQNISPCFIEKLILSMPRRLQAVIDNKGFATKY